MVSPPAFCPKRSILAGLDKFLAVGCGLNEIAPSADSSGTSHLSPDGGGVTRAAVHRLVADGYDSSSQPILFVRNPWPTNQTILKTATIRATVYIFSNPSKSWNPILLDLQESVRRNHNKTRCC